MPEFPEPSIWFQHRVSYGETDAMSVMYYAEYLHLFERSRSEFIRAHGMSYATVEEREIMLPVREAQCRYKRPARFDDLLNVHVGISKWGRASMTFYYEVYDAEKKNPACHRIHRTRLHEPDGTACPCPRMVTGNFHHN